MLGKRLGATGRDRTRGCPVWFATDRNRICAAPQPVARPAAGLVVMAILAAACANPRLAARAPIVFPFATDTNRVEAIANGVTRRFVWSSTGPWSIHVLDVDLSKCYSAVAVKGQQGAVGRTRTTELLRQIDSAHNVIGGVNADFFSLAGFLGVPSGALISRGRVITGPGPQPVLAIDSTGLLRALRLEATGSLQINGVSHAIRAWNRAAPAGLALYDRSFGDRLDTASSIIEVTLEGTAPARVVRVDTTATGADISRSGAVIVAGKSASPAIRAALLDLRLGDTVRTSIGLGPIHPREAVGGRPMLARDSAVVPEIETEGQASFRARNPRTAAGIARNGTRLILVVVDGRQAPMSDGMTLRELADLMLALGSRDAINLDGGGSSALVYADPGSKALRLANHPSDAAGERAVGDALGIVRGCH